MILPAIAPLETRRSAAPTQPAVAVEAVSKRFVIRRGWVDHLMHPGRRTYATAVDRVSFAAATGEIVGLLGANGAGKTTLLKMLSTLVIPDSGSARVMGHDVVKEPRTVRRLLSPVPADERSLDWRLSARENLRFFAALLGLEREAARGRIEEVLQRVQLHEAGQKLVALYSSGMRQRLLIARALLARPRVLLLDEPTRSLDPVAARDFRRFLRQDIAGAAGCTVILATHDPDEALEMCDRVIILHRGRLLAEGAPAELSRAYSVARYRLWTRTPDHQALRLELLPLLPLPVRTLGEQDEHTVIEFDLPATHGDPGSMLARLVTEGVHVSRFEKVQPTLADLLERVTAGAGGPA
jgi:ABC-2 type transport system ATP-binding protein